MRCDPEKMKPDFLRSIGKVWGLARLSQLKLKAKQAGALYWCPDPFWPHGQWGQEVKLKSGVNSDVLDFFRIPYGPVPTGTSVFYPYSVPVSFSTFIRQWTHGQREKRESEINYRGLLAQLSFSCVLSSVHCSSICRIKTWVKQVKPPWHVHHSSFSISVPSILRYSAAQLSHEEHEDDSATGMLPSFWIPFRSH